MGPLSPLQAVVSSRPVIADVESDLVSNSDTEWIVLAAVLVFLQHAAALVLSYASGFASRPPTLEYMAIALIVSLVGGSIIALPDIRRLWREREPHPIARLFRDAKLVPVASYLIGFQLYALQMGALTWLKQMLPEIVPFWADRPLASLDRALLGTDAWRLLPTELIYPLDIIYVFWAPVTLVMLNVTLCLKPSQTKSRAIVAYFLVVGLMGVCGQYLLSSAGPVFYDRLFGGSEFFELMARLKMHAPVVSRTSNYLWMSYIHHVDKIGAGISAMPSLHVAVSAWLALALSSFWPKLRMAGWAFWLVMFVGSFGLGWHYFLDGAVGTIGAIGCWLLASCVFRRTPDPVDMGVRVALS